MKILFHELKISKNSFLIWSGVIIFMIFICMIMYPEMKSQMDAVTDMFANMGGFTSAFGMDKVNIGTPLGFYAIECGSILGLGGAFFAAMSGISVLSKEERDRTAEFLLTHPISRFNIVLQKLISVFLQLTFFNVLVTAIGCLSFAFIGESIELQPFFLTHLAFYILQLEISFICFAISAFIKTNGIGLGIGIAVFFYFLNIVANITESASALKYITPFGYADASDIISKSSIDISLVLIGAAIAMSSAAIGFIKYCKKDIAS